MTVESPTFPRICLPFCSLFGSQRQSHQSTAPSIQSGASIRSNRIPPSPISSHHASHHLQVQNRSRSDSPPPSPTLSQAYLPSHGLTSMEQDHFSPPQVHPHSGDHYDYDQQYHHSPSHSRGHSHSGHGSGSVSPPPESSEPVGHYKSDPTYQAQYAAHPTYGPTLTPHGISSPQYQPSIDTPFEPPAQTRAFPVPSNSVSHARQPLVSQEMDSHEPTHHDWRCHPLFRRSRCTGRRKALCIGINYEGQSNPLHGCVDDARNVYQFLLGHNYSHSNIIVLTDDNPNPRSQPTRKNILNAMRWLVEDSHSDDALFIHYSGHGGRTRDQDGDELDGWDEVIFPVDYSTVGIIDDDLLHDSVVKPLTAGCRLTAVFDSCHSGSILDLNYEFHSNGRPKSSPVAPASQQSKSTPADVVCFSGCKDSQTSADTVQGGVAVGAMSYAYLKVLKRNPQITYIDLLRGVREILKKNYSQKPQLSASHPVDINHPFIM